jgi:hypothetical protein
MSRILSQTKAPIWGETAYITSGNYCCIFNPTRPVHSRLHLNVVSNGLEDSVRLVGHLQPFLSSLFLAKSSISGLYPASQKAAFPWERKLHINSRLLPRIKIGAGLATVFFIKQRTSHCGGGGRSCTQGGWNSNVGEYRSNYSSVTVQSSLFSFAKFKKYLKFKLTQFNGYLWSHIRVVN